METSKFCVFLNNLPPGLSAQSTKLSTLSLSLYYTDVDYCWKTFAVPNSLLVRISFYGKGLANLLGEVAALDLKKLEVLFLL